MLNIGVVSHLVGGVFFLGLAVLLVTGWRGRLQGGLLVTAALGSAAWALVLAWEAGGANLPPPVLHTAQVLRDAGWLAFLTKLLSVGFRGVPRRVASLVGGVWVLVLGLGWLPAGWPDEAVRVQLGFFGLLALSLLGLVLVEQIYRNADTAQRWALKYLGLGIGGIFVYDLVLYADALMFLQADPSLWQARGLVNAMAVPLIGVSAARNPQWSLDVFVSRRFMFYGTTLVAAGVFLLAMAAGGYYVRLYGGDWGAVGQAVFVAAALLGLAVALFSGQVRARLRVFLSKHFYHYKYDYRDEWIRFMGTLAEGEPGPAIRQRVIQALAQIVDSTNGQLWMRSGDDFLHVAEWNRTAPAAVLRGSDPFVRFLDEHNWIVDLRERAVAPERYPGMALPPWLADDAGAWLVIPLRHHGALAGVVLLGRPRAPRETNWEDRDLLKTAGQQAGGYLALLEATEALSEARQFEAFNRLSAYVVHDLKNMVAQLALVVSNAGRHRDNPAFVDDAIRTIDNTVGRMNRLLAQLRKGRFDAPTSTPVPLCDILGAVVERRRTDGPAPVLAAGPEAGAARILADAERLGLVLEHLVQNAQEATTGDGLVSVGLDVDGDEARITICDDGIGMTDDFIRTRLFRPFDTTKGNAGMGIGVYEAREFFHGIGGRLEVASRPGEGSTFTIRLPLHLADQLDSDGQRMAEVAN